MKLFIHPDERRLRSGWRLFIHSILVMGISLVIGMLLLVFSGALATLGDNTYDGQLLSPTTLLLSQIAFFMGVTIATFVVRRWLDRRSFSSLGVGISWKAVADLIAGFFIAGGMMGGIFGILWSFGWLSFTGFGWQTEPVSQSLSRWVVVIVLFVLVGWTEELLSRGYHLQTLTEGLNRFWGILLSSLVFAILHRDNPGFSFIAFLGLFFSGLFFCFAYFKSRALWLPIGLHIGWNFFEGVVFGFQVSGLTDFPRLITQTVSGPVYITGGEFGPEAGLVLVPGLILGLILVWLYCQKRSDEESVII